jgi:hypothetical protein
MLMCRQNESGREKIRKTYRVKFSCLFIVKKEKN